MIELEKELKKMCKLFGLTEKELLSDFRTLTRQMWGNSEFRKRYLASKAIKVENTNPRSMKRFPTVVKYKCEMCGELFSAQGVEVDHIESENSLRSFSDIEHFFKTIVLSPPGKLQILCKPKTKTVKGKKVKTSFGCHEIKTFSERYGVSIEQAKVEKEFILIKKEKRVIDKLIDLGVKDIPKLKKDQKEMLYKLLIENRSKENDE